jgi:hypothetical protein
VQQHSNQTAELLLESSLRLLNDAAWQTRGADIFEEVECGGDGDYGFLAFARATHHQPPPAKQ